MAFYNGDSETASELLRRAAVVYRISRFPYVSPDDDDDDPETNIKRKAFTRQKAAYTIATSVWRNPLTEHVIPHTHRAGRDGPRIPIYVRLPEDTAAPGWCHDPVPVVLIMTGLDGYRPDNSQRTHEITARGWAVVIAEIPGTGDSPADPADPESADRLWSSVLEYMRSLGVFDMTKVAVWGLSAGGYYAVRAAHTHRGRLKGCIGHGPGTHYFLDEEWLARVEDHEYPFPYDPLSYNYYLSEANCVGSSAAGRRSTGMTILPSSARRRRRSFLFLRRGFWTCLVHGCCF